MTQAQLAAESGLSVTTVKRIEAGESTQTTTLIRVLRELGLLGGLEVLVPAPGPSLKEPLWRTTRFGREWLATIAWKWAHSEPESQEASGPLPCSN